MGCRSQAKHVSQYQNYCTLVRVPWAPQGLSKSRTVPGLPVPCRDPLIPPIPLLPAAPPKAMPFPSSSRAGRAAQRQGCLAGPAPAGGQNLTPLPLQSIAGNGGAASSSHMTTVTPAVSFLPPPRCFAAPPSSGPTLQGTSGFTLLLPQVPAKPLSNNRSTLRPPSELWHPPSGQEEGADKQLPPELRLVSGLYLLSNFSRSDPPKRSTQRGKAEPQDKAEEDS